MEVWIGEGGLVVTPRVLTGSPGAAPWLGEGDDKRPADQRDRQPDPWRCFEIEQPDAPIRQTAGQAGERVRGD
jgi:hypothetical protein